MSEGDVIELNYVTTRENAYRKGYSASRLQLLGNGWVRIEQLGAVRLLPPHAIVDAMPTPSREGTGS